MKRVFALGLAAASLVGCATTPPAAPPAPPVLACAQGEKPAEVAQLFFGRNVGATPGVSERDWDAFLEKEVVTRFPDGLSVIDTAGVWRGKDGLAVHELGKAVVVVLPGHSDDADRLTAVTQAYKARFAQESVLTSRVRSCVAF